jgi:prophage regulatory protein
LVQIIIRNPEVARRTGISDSQRWRLEQKGEFPRRVKLGTMAVGWFEEEIDEWLRTRERAGAKQPPSPKKRRKETRREGETNRRPNALDP